MQIQCKRHTDCVTQEHIRLLALSRLEICHRQQQKCLQMIDTWFVNIDLCSRLHCVVLTGSHGATVTSAEVRNVTNRDCVDCVDHKLW
jgi:hypothetical protein